MTKKLISIITPCYNEQDGIKQCYQKVKEIIDPLVEKYEFEHIFCDNSSQDNTFNILKDIALADSSVKVIRNTRNFGILKNTYNGIMRSSGDAVFLFLPADLQDPPELIPVFIEKWEENYQIVYGLRAQRDEFVLLAWSRKLYYKILSNISNVDYPPNAGDFQLVDKVIIDELKRTYIADPFVRMNTFYCGYNSIGIPYRWKKREHGKSRNPLGSMFAQGLEGLTSFSSLPIRLSSALGLAIIIFSIIYLLFIILGILMGFLSTGSPGTLTIIFLIVIFGGTNLLAIGLMGEYIVRILNQVRNRPYVLERETINFDL